MKRDETLKSSRSAKPVGVSFRALFLAFLATPFNVFFLVYAGYTGRQFVDGESLLTNAIAVLFLLQAVNSLLKIRWSRWALRPGEILTIYLIMVMSTALSCSVWDFNGSLALGITYPFWFATPENGWQTLLWPHFPGWLTVRDPIALEGFYAGRANPYSHAVLQAWLGPALWWTSIVTTIAWVCLCLNSIIRRRWEEEEKLSFPMAVVPIQMTSDETNPLRSRLFWIAGGVALLLTLSEALTSLFPVLPKVPTQLEYGRMLQPPFTFIRFPYFSWTPWQLGLCYLIPPDLALSLLLFDLLWMGQYVIAGHLGWSTSPWEGFPYGDQQCAGGLLALIVIILWSDRNYLAQVIRRTLGLPSALSDDKDKEALSYRGAVLGAVVGFMLLWIFLAYAGMKAWVIPTFLLLFFAVCLAISRFRAQLGPPEHALEGMMPNRILTTLVGSSALGGSTLGIFALMGTFSGPKVVIPHRFNSKL